MQRGPSGRYESSVAGGEAVRAFVPAPLPPSPALAVDGPLQVLQEQAGLALGRLDSLTTLLPDAGLFLYMYVRKEAVLSSQIEGTQSSLSDLLLYELDEAPGVPLDDVVEVSNYVAAMEHGLTRMREGFPLSNRLLREIHGVLLAKGRGSDRDPGHFRRSQNWIGGLRPGAAHYVPPPPQLVQECMGELERFLHDGRAELPVLVLAALAHVQFESIHPFLDGNGRVGRLLITLLLVDAGVLRAPLLYLSLYLKSRRDEYYRQLDAVRADGDWEGWLRFFLEGVRDTADQAVATAHRLIRLVEGDRLQIKGQGRAAGSAMRVHQALTERPILTLREAAARTGRSFPAVANGMRVLEDAGLVRELTGRRRDRLYGYEGYLEILREGTEQP
jgi:Fic family protein